MASVRKFGSFRTMTAHELVTAQNAKRKAMRQKFEANQAAVNEKLLTVGDARSQGLAEIVAQIALKRITEEGKVKAEKNAASAKLSTEVDTSKADIRDSVFSSSGTATLDGGTKIDLDSGTLTLSNGTVIDIKTGVKKVNITV